VFSLLWFSGINGDTAINDIGWTYVVLALLIIFIIQQIRQLIKEW
jgi:hypothetical protein